jgi:hypothetical protein
MEARTTNGCETRVQERIEHQKCFVVAGEAWISTVAPAQCKREWKSITPGSPTYVSVVDAPFAAACSSS